jgi:large subunit ribosomal protein L10
MDKDTKAQFVESFGQKLKDAKLAVVTDFRGIDVATITQFRKTLNKTAGTEFRVVKNTLLRRAIDGTPWQGLGTHLTGTNALMLSYQDVVEAAKALTAFAKDHEKLSIKGGVLGGKGLSPQQVSALAELPRKEVIQAQLLGLLQAPARNLVSLLANVNRQLLNVLVAYKGKLEGGAGAT